MKIELNNISLQGDLEIPGNAIGLVIFSHGSGSSRFSPRNIFVAQQLRKRRLATFLLDLLTEQEDKDYDNRFDVDLLSDRLIAATHQLQEVPAMKALPAGYFGASTGAASALLAAAAIPDRIQAVVCRGGRPDLALNSLSAIRSPTLLIVGELDQAVIKLNQAALRKLPGIKKLQIVKGATHLFEEKGALEEVAQAAGDWFARYLKKTQAQEYQNLNAS